MGIGSKYGYRKEPESIKLLSIIASVKTVGTENYFVIGNQ